MQDNQNGKLTPISEIGEFGLIGHITRDFPVSSDRLVKGVGDDAAVYDLQNGKVQLITTDLLAEGVHFDLSYTPLQHLGYKAVSVNVSDILAMNGNPLAITVSIAMSNRFTVEAIDSLYKGIKYACDNYGIEMIGGDTSSSQAGLIISITAFGEAKKEDVVYRDGAKENDLVCVTGDLGAAYAGLQILEREKQVFKQNSEMEPDLAGFDYVIGRQLKPEAQVDGIKNLRTNGVKINSMIDISDGLGSELNHICRQSKVGVQVYEDKLPIDYETSKVAESFEISPVVYGLNGGEDYELLFTAPLDQLEVLKELKGIFVIGHVTDESAGLNIVLKSGQTVPIEAQGWTHFN